MIGAQQFALCAFGGANDVINIAAAVSVTDAIGGVNAEAGLEFRNDGTIYQYTLSDGVGYTFLGTWCTPGASAVNYFMKSTVTAGSLSTDPSAGAVIAMSSTRLWKRNRTIAGTATGTITFYVYSDSGGTNQLDTKAGIVLTATK